MAVLAALLIGRRRARRGHPAPVRTATADVVMVAGTAPWISSSTACGSGG
ncbi:MAG: hypothetical protein IRZ07_04945 [Microbispora sp.]|nr:hypothetical protein [Microbispora sp.]